jgi:hypothetical protein
MPHLSPRPEGSHGPAQTLGASEPGLSRGPCLSRHAGRALPPVPEVEVAVAGRNERNTKVQGRDLVGIKGDADE